MVIYFAVAKMDSVNGMKLFQCTRFQYFGLQSLFQEKLFLKNTFSKFRWYCIVLCKAIFIQLWNGLFCKQFNVTVNNTSRSKTIICTLLSTKIQRAYIYHVAVMEYIFFLIWITLTLILRSLLPSTLIVIKQVKFH